MLDVGIDHLTTIFWRTYTALTIAAASGLSIFLIVLLACYRTTTTTKELNIGPKETDAHAPRNLLIATAAAFVVSWTTGSFMGVLAQHIPGKMMTIPATVNEIDSSPSARGSCSSEITVLPGIDMQAMSFCLLLISGSGSGPRDLKPNEHVSIQLKQTILGDVVESVSRIGPQKLQ